MPVWTLNSWRVNRWKDEISVEVDLGVVDPVEREIVPLAPVARNRDLLRRAVSSKPRARLAAVTEARRDVRAQRDELQEVAPVEPMLRMVRPLPPLSLRVTWCPKAVSARFRKKLLEFYRTPQLPGAVNNYVTALARPQNRDQFVLRTDYVESSKSSWAGRYSWGDE